MTIASRWNLGRVAKRFWDVVEQGWYLGFTAFGGPPVHFKIVRMRLSWSFLGYDMDLRTESRVGKRERTEDHVLTFTVP
jgi:hypothetical protein